VLRSNPESVTAVFQTAFAGNVRRGKEGPGFAGLKSRTTDQLPDSIRVCSPGISAIFHDVKMSGLDKKVSYRTVDSLHQRIITACKYLFVILLMSPGVQAQGPVQSIPEMSLEQMISAALSSHPAAQVQRLLEESAQADVDSANWQFYPTFSFAIENAQTGASDPSYPGDDRVSILSLQQPLWTGGRLTAGLTKAEAGVIASQASLAETRQQLALRVVQSYGDWLVARLKTHAYEKSLDTHERLRNQVKRRIEQGASAQSDLILAVSRMQAVVAEISVARAQMDIALTRLGQLLGMNPSGFNVSIAEPRALNADVQKLLERAFIVNPSLQKAQAEMMIQKAVIAERRADLSPELFLRVERQYGNHSFSNADPENRIFLGVNSRFGAGLSSLSNVKGAVAQYQAALAEVEVQRRSISELVLADYALATSSEIRLEALRISLNAASQVSESYDRQFLAGRKTWVDVMNAARELAQTEAQLADIQSAQVVVTWRLAIYTQGLGERAVLPSPGEVVNTSMNQSGTGDPFLTDGTHTDKHHCESDPSAVVQQTVCQRPGQGYTSVRLVPGYMPMKVDKQ